MAKRTQFYHWDLAYCKMMDIVYPHRETTLYDYTIFDEEDDDDV